MIASNFIYTVKKICLFFLIFTCLPPSSEQGCPPHQSMGPFRRKRSHSLQSKWKPLLFSWGVTSSTFLLWDEVDQTRQLCSDPLLSKMKKGSWWPNYLSHSSGLSLVECLVSPSIQDTLINTVLGRFCLDFDNLAPMPFSYVYHFFFKLPDVLFRCSYSIKCCFLHRPPPVCFKVIQHDSPALESVPTDRSVLEISTVGLCVRTLPMLSDSYQRRR